jgi:cystathionine beta-lyase/cystathionine gamma-synthase
MSIRPSDFTKVVHAGVEPDPRTGAIMTPIFQTSTYVQQAPNEHKGWDYSRAGNPTRDALEEAYAALEGAKYGLAFSSGLAAEQAIIQILNPGDHVLVCDDVYGGTGRLFRRLFAKYQLSFDFIDMTDLKNVAAAVKPNTRMFWIETPTNPLLKVIDIEAVSRIAHQASAVVVVDNTFASPIFQSPFELGADIITHSTTKYIGGHSDIIGGAVMINDDKLYEQIKFVQFAAGAVPGPFECFLLLRSVKTLAIRMEKHDSNAAVVARYLSEHSRVKEVFFPGLPSHPQHALAKKQMRGFAGMLSFNLKGTYAEVVTFLQSLKVFSLAESLGGVESLVNHPEKMTHASVPEEMRKQLGIGPNLIRLSCGIEHADDLISDLEQALKV